VGGAYRRQAHMTREPCRTTGCSQRLPAYAALQLPGAAEPQRSGARAADGGRGVVSQSRAVVRWLARRATRAGRPWHAGCRQAPWGRDAGAKVEAPTTPEQRPGADRPQRPLCPVRVSVPGGGGSPRAFGGPRGGGAAGRHTHERGGWGWCKERGPRAGRRWRAGALGAGRGGHIESPYHPRTTHWSRQGKLETLGLGESP
jgi:hypothetical protein